MAVRRGQAQQAAEIRELARLGDDDLIAQTPANTSLSRPLPQMEMSRRFKNAVEALTAELVMFRESSDSAARQSAAAAGKLARLTWVIIVLTVAVAGLTAALVILTVRGSG
ncbi:MAG TPA: hypothetical protein VGI96_01240 [Streptosporangiaceae bacterium]|jgi:hypothetical protein